MASLELDPDTTVRELEQTRQAIGHAIQWLAGTECKLPDEARLERIDDMIDALRVHDRALAALYALDGGRPQGRGRRRATRRRRTVTA